MVDFIDWSGFWQLLQDSRIPDSVTRILPATCDRFLESRFFVEEVATLNPEVHHIRKVNWLVSAHFAAVIGIYDAARTDFDQAGWASRFRESQLAREFFLTSSAEKTIDRDPLAMNRAYRDLRNLRVHYAVPLAVLRDRVLEPELAGITPMGTNRWFLRPIVLEEHRRLKKSLLTEEEINRFNEHIDVHPLITVLSQHLYILFRTILDTVKDTPAQHSVHPNPEEHRGHGGGTAVLGDGVRVFRQFAWLEVGSVKMALSRPAHAARRVTPAVRRLRKRQSPILAHC